MPDRSPTWWSFRSRQAHVAEPFREIDDRVGYYGKLEWRPDAPFMINAFFYDNAGDETSYDDFQTSWKTRFANFGVMAQLSDDTQLLAQAMTGSTAWIPLANRPIAKVDDVGFRSVYLLLDHTFGSQGLAARLDAFETTDENQAYSLNSTPETGWSITAAWRNQFGANLTWMIEGVYVDSERASRTQVGMDDQQSQLQVQTSLRMGF